jgi:hypothetical protein
MYIDSNFRMAPALFASLFTASFPAMAEAGAGASVIASRTAEADRKWLGLSVSTDFEPSGGFKVYPWGQGTSSDRKRRRRRAAA